jgi:hypothetical protein
VEADARSLAFGAGVLGISTLDCDPRPLRWALTLIDPANTAVVPSVRSKLDRALSRISVDA